ncbi:hypothetical protein NMY22_g7110 [Coprinellus aureogranulatus]|nr:hypothetical protein NMY22_g7110 [Coprinellus aureogranulatus]
MPWLRKMNLVINWRTGALIWDWEVLTRRTGQEEETEEVDGALADSIIRGVPNEETREIWANSVDLDAMLPVQEETTLEYDELKKKIPGEYHEYLEVFSEKAAGRLPSRKIYDHAIDLKADFVPKSFPIYNLMQLEEQALKDFINENLKKGYIRKSQSPMASPFFFVPKKDGKKRPCQDYRYLNQGTVKNAYPLPLISDIMDKIQGKRYFTKMDVRWGYNNV